MTELNFKRFWVSWYEPHNGGFEYGGPWWISGETMEEPPRHTICAAVVAENEECARNVIRASHDDPMLDLEWRFANERADDWEPFCDRFARADWMKWPHPVWPVVFGDAGSSGH